MSKIGLFIRSLIIASLILGVIPTSVSAKTVENKSVNGIVEEANPNSIEYYSYDGINYQVVRRCFDYCY